MKSRKEKFFEYEEKYHMIPKGYIERINWMCDHFKLSEKEMEDIIRTKNDMMNSIHYKSLKIILYEEPEGTPRPRARLVNRYNVLDMSKSNSNFIHIYSITGKEDNMYMKRLVSENEYLEANNLIYTPCDVVYNAYFKTPSSTSKKFKFLSEIGLIRPPVKPDFDNIGKKYSDMYNSNIWLDDNLVIDGMIRKWYSILPRVEIDLKYADRIYTTYHYKAMAKRLNDSGLNYYKGV